MREHNKVTLVYGLVAILSGVGAIVLGHYVGEGLVLLLGVGVC
jgi:hypothetical protein